MELRPRKIAVVEASSKPSRTPRTSNPLGVKISFEDLEVGKRYLAKYTGPKPKFSGFRGWLLAGEFVKSEYISGKPYVVLKATKHIDGRLIRLAAFKIIEKDGTLFDLASMPSSGYISKKHPDREIYLRSNKWVFYPDTCYSMTSLSKMLPCLAGLPENTLSLITHMSQPALSR